MSEQQYTIELGWMRKPLAEQLSSQGLPFDAETIRHLDLDADAASRLKVRGVLPYAAGERAYDKIVKLVWAEVRRAVKAAPPATPNVGDNCASEASQSALSEHEEKDLLPNPNPPTPHSEEEA